MTIWQEKNLIQNNYVLLSTVSVYILIIENHIPESIRVCNYIANLKSFGTDLVVATQNRCLN